MCLNIFSPLFSFSSSFSKCMFSLSSQDSRSSSISCSIGVNLTFLLFVVCRFSCLYTYHVILLMHFTIMSMMNLRYLMCRNIEKLTTLVQSKPPHQQYNNIYHFALIKIVVLHQLRLLNVSWDDFISHEVFASPQVTPSVFHEARWLSHQQEVHATRTTSVPVFFTYQKGTKRLFAPAK